MAIAVSSDGLPQPLFDRKTGEPVVLWGEDMFPHVKLRSHNHYYPSPEMHVAAAEALAGPVASLLAAPAAVRAASQPARRREVLAHIHIFKNAGTSLDELFHRSFGTAFKAVDPEHEADVWSEEELLEVVRADPRLLCISSHQIRQPLIGDSRIKILPYFLIRHPISRLKSVYEYLRQQAQPDRISEMAQTLAFKTFVQTCQGFPNTERLVRNFQTGVLGRSGALEEQRRDRRWEWHQPVGEEHLLEALKFMESVPTVGVVERLEDSVAALCAAYALRFPQLGKHVFHANRSQEFKPLPEQLDEIREEVGAEFYDRLLQQNAMDLALWDAANRRLP